VTPNQQRIQSFVNSEIAPWTGLYQPGPWLTRETATRFEAYLERAAISYVEQRALTEAVVAVLGPANPATPFVVAGLKQVLDAETPYLVRLAREHQQEVAFLGVCALLFVGGHFAKN
jgi:hypothetical protein